MNVDKVLAAYIEAALWSSCDDEGIPLDRNYSQEDIAEGSRAKMRADCARFVEETVEDDRTAYALACPASYTPEEMFGHDFWLTRTWSGVGFWDRGWLPEDLRDRLTDRARACGEVWMYVGDDGQIHCD